MARRVAHNPFRFYGASTGLPADFEPTDSVAVEVGVRHGHLWLTLPQFGIDCCSPLSSMEEQDADSAATEAIAQIPKRILAFYRALTELPDEYVNEVEQAQLDLIERALLPWLAVVLAESPQYWALPPAASQQASDDLAAAV